MTTAGEAKRRFDDIKGMVLWERPSSYVSVHSPSVGVYITLRMDNP